MASGWCTWDVRISLIRVCGQACEINLQCCASCLDPAAVTELLTPVDERLSRAAGGLRDIRDRQQVDTQCQLQDTSSPASCPRAISAALKGSSQPAGQPSAARLDTVR